MMTNRHLQKKSVILLFLTALIFNWAGMTTLRCSAFCTSPSLVYENQFNLSGADQIAGVVDNRYLPVFSDGKYVQIADTYDNTVVAEITLAGVPVDGVVDPEDETKGWFLLKPGGLVEFDMSSPAPSLWEAVSIYELPGLVCTVDAGGAGNPVVAAGVVLSEGMEIYLFDKKTPDVILQTLEINETGTISDIMVTDQGVYVLLEASGRVLLFDKESGQLKAENDAGSMPVSFALDSRRKQILIANPEPGTITVLDAETLGLKKTIDDPNLMTDPVSIAVARDAAYIGCSGSKKGIVSLDLDDLVLLGKGASLSRAPGCLMHFQEEQVLYFTDGSGLSYLFDDTCLRIKTRTGQGVWRSSVEVLTAPDETFGIRVEGGTPPFDLPSTGSVLCQPDESDNSGRSFVCTASHEGDYPLYITDGAGNSRLLMVRTAAPLSISPSGVLATRIAADPLVFTASGGFSPVTWQTSYGILSSCSGRTVVYFPPNRACDDLIMVRDRTGAILYKTVQVTVPGIAVTPAQRVVLPGETCSFTLVGPATGTYTWKATEGDVTVEGKNGQYTAPLKTGEYQIIVSNDVNDTETAIAKVFVVSEQLTLTPEQAVTGRQESMAFLVSGGKGPYIWSAERGDISTSTGSSVVYTSSKISGKTRLSVVDTGGRVASAEITVKGDFRLSPVVSVVRPGDEISFSLMGASGTPGWQAEEGTFITKGGEGTVYEAPRRPGTYDVLAMDQRGYTAWSRVYVADEELIIKTGSDRVEANETVLLSVAGGVSPYSWTAAQGMLSSSSGRTVTWIAPKQNADLESDGNILITVSDSMDSLAARDITVEVPGNTGCLYLSESLRLFFPCVEVGNDRFKFSMNYLSGLTWVLDTDSLTEAALEEDYCLNTEDDLGINISCCEYGGTRYSFSFNYAGGLSWSMNPDSVSVVP